MMTTEALQKLKAASNQTIAQISSGQRPKDAINWANLRCVEAAWVTTDTGEAYAQVLIEEAAPDCFRFQTAVIAQLELLGFPGVRVVTEW